MTTDNIKEIIAQGEGNSVEFKRSFTSDLGREMCAFANSSGGKILLGVSDSREIVGISDTNRIRSQIQSIARSVEPPVGIEIECIDSIMCISVPSQTKKPYSFRGKFYVREGANSQRLSRDELGEFYFREGILHFDAAICQRFDLDLDLDQDQWSMFKNRAKIPSYMKP
ncbi:MAG: putative DNA binding domain-containing protein [Bacteroidetes bacterium]|nr:putative DNA binding domain-containing protein [Bacteroidota bacterium]